MDKYEYKLRADEIKTLIGEGRYAEAVQIADTIDWKKVKSVRMLCTISDLYKINRRYEESREILLIANSRYPDGRYIVYSLCELSIKLQDIVHAVEYFKEFVRIAPHNTSRYILQYKLYVAQDVSLEERIAVLQEFKKHDYREKWGYELAFLYHRVGLTTECIEECDELFLWFGGGRFVMKALELKALHEPLSPEQKKVYERYKSGGQEEPVAKESDAYDKERDEMGHDESTTPQEPEDGEFHVKTFDGGQYNTINLQQVIADSLKELQKKPAPPVPQETKVMPDIGHGQEEERKPLLDSTADTGVLGITEEDLNAFEDDEPDSVGAAEDTEAPAETAEDRAFAQSLQQTAASIATDDTIWMPGIPEMARYAAEQGEILPPEQEISAKTIAQATGELPMAVPVDAIKEAPLENPVEEALSALNGGEIDGTPAAEESVQETPGEGTMGALAASPEKRLIDELQTEVGQARDEMRKLRAAERRAELKSRERSGGMREVSSDTRRLGQTREYTPVARMDQAVEAALSEKPATGDVRVLTPVLQEEIASADGARVSRVIRPNRKVDESGYDNLLAQSSDGQISMAVDEKAELDRQITGQISINEFLTSEGKPTREQIAHQLAVLEGRIPPDAPAEAPTSKADEQELKNAEGEAAQPVPDADVIEEAVQPVAAEPPQEEPAEEVTQEETADEDFAEAEPLPEETFDQEDREDSGEEAIGETVEEPVSEAAGEPSEETAEADEEDDRVLRVMTPEEKELFGPYIHRKRSRRQIINAIDSLSMAAYAGNVIITGEEGAGTINLAKGLIRSIQLSDANFSGQIAKISGRAMNRKRVDAIVDKLAGGALIIQGAAGMNNETTKALLKALQSENKGIVVVLEDTRKGIEKYLKKHPEITECFNVRVDVEALATKELVAYAKQYALDKEFSMDEFAVLALHKRIDEMQTAEHEVTIAEVRGIVDEAIHRATRKNPGHFFDILLQKRYDDEDMIILREKDFLR